MRAAQVIQPIGPDGVKVVDVPDATVRPGSVLVRVHSVGVAFPDLLLSQGQYQLRPEPPFTLGVDVAGTVEALGDDVEEFEVGQRVAAVMPYGGAAELVSVPVDAVVPLPDHVFFDQGAALGMNYLTAQFALAERARLRPDETVLVHGAAGGVGTATIQVARGMGARVLAVVSTPEKAEVARAAGADDVLLADGFLERVQALTQGRGVDVVVDVVGGDLFTDSLRALAPLGRLLVVGFAAGQGIPEVKVNRLLLNNVDVRGVGWGAYAMVRPGYIHDQWRALLPMIEAGIIDPPIGSEYDLEELPQALRDLQERRATGKLVVRVN